MSSERLALLATIQHLTTRLQSIPDNVERPESVKSVSSVPESTDNYVPVTLNRNAAKATDSESVIRKQKAKKEKGPDTRTPQQKEEAKAKMAKLRQLREQKKLAANLPKPAPATVSEKRKHSVKLNIADVSEDEPVVTKPKKESKSKKDATATNAEVSDKILLKVRPL